MAGATVYVGNLPFTATAEEVREIFERDGRRVVDVRLINDRETGRPRGFGFVELASDEDARSAISALQSAQLGGRTLTVTEARKPGR